VRIRSAAFLPLSQSGCKPCRAGDFIGVPPSHDEWLDNLDAIPGTLHTRSPHARLNCFNKLVARTDVAADYRLSNFR
jgi:hypothetical protein